MLLDESWIQGQKWMGFWGKILQLKNIRLYSRDKSDFISNIKQRTFKHFDFLF